MRRALAALAALLIAAPALAAGPWSGKGLVLLPPDYSSAEGNSVGNQLLGTLLDQLRENGADFDTADPYTTPTLFLTNARVDLGINNSIQYDWLIVMGYRTATSGARYPAGTTPDSLTLRAGWPAKPTLFVFTVNTPSASIYANAATCSTGAANTGGAFPNLWGTHSIHLVGSPLVWKEWNLWNRVPRAPAPGITRTILALGYSAAGNAGGGNTGAKLCTDCDSIGRPTQATADTMIFWARYRSSVEPAPLFFVAPNPGAGGAPSVSSFQCALAALDSATGGKVIGVTRGWRPKQIGFYIGRAFARGTYMATGSNAETFGTFCYADSCDSVNVKAGIDSVNALGVPVVVGVNVDSIATYPYELAWWKRIAKARFSPESWTGVNGGNVGNATSTKAVDIFGVTRSRTLISAGRLAGTACASGDTTVACALEFAKERVRAAGLVPLSRTIAPPEFDHIPANFSRPNLPTRDSLGATFLRAGYTAVIVNPDVRSSTPSSSFGLDGSGGVAVGLAPAALSARQRSDQVFTDRNHTDYLGRVHYLTTRGIVSDGPISGFIGSHPWHQEFLVGVWSSMWFPGDLKYYYHTFKTPLSVFYVRAGELGGTGALNNAQRPAQHIGAMQMKWIVNGSIKAPNALGLPGKPSVTASYPEDILP